MGNELGSTKPRYSVSCGTPDRTRRHAALPGGVPLRCVLRVALVHGPPERAPVPRKPGGGAWTADDAGGSEEGLSAADRQAARIRQRPKGRAFSAGKED